MVPIFLFEFNFDVSLNFLDIKLVCVHCDINRMDVLVDLYIHHGGTWVMEPSLSYVG